MNTDAPAAPRFDAASFEHPIRGIETVERTCRGSS
jgi:hypothetical protein